MSSFERIVTVPSSLAVDRVADWSRRLFSTPPTRTTLFNLSEVQNAPPHGMLFVGSCIRRYRRIAFETAWQAPTRPGAIPEISNWLRQQPQVEILPNLANTYLSHMGFWQSIGLAHGRAIGEARGSSRYLPISMLLATELGREARARSMELGDIIYNRSDRLAEILAQDSGDSIETTISYALRELIRNVFEHSGTDRLWYSAQFWPSKDKVEMAVLDEGCGILTSLTRNPTVYLSDESQAIIKATERGVTGSIPRVAVTSLSGDLAESRWTNSGWGLFVLRRLAEEAGSLLIFSNNSAATFGPGTLRVFPVAFVGTIVRLVLKPSHLKNLLRTILDKSVEDDPPSKLTPSMLARLRDSDS